MRMTKLRLPIPLPYRWLQTWSFSFSSTLIRVVRNFLLCWNCCLFDYLWDLFVESNQFYRMFFLILFFLYPLADYLTTCNSAPCSQKIIVKCGRSASGWIAYSIWELSCTMPSFDENLLTFTYLFWQRFCQFDNFWTWRERKCKAHHYCINYLFHCIFPICVGRILLLFVIYLCYSLHISNPSHANYYG